MRKHNVISEVGENVMGFLREKIPFRLAQKIIAIILVMALVMPMVPKNYNSDNIVQETPSDSIVEQTDTSTGELPEITPTPTPEDIVATPEVTETPEITEEPIATEEPAITEEPIVTEEPAVTDTPVVSEQPVVTDTPIVSQQPEITPTPKEITGFIIHPTAAPEKGDTPVAPTPASEKGEVPTAPTPTYQAPTANDGVDKGDIVNAILDNPEFGGGLGLDIGLGITPLAIDNRPAQVPPNAWPITVTGVTNNGNYYAQAAWEDPRHIYVIIYCNVQNKDVFYMALGDQLTGRQQDQRIVMIQNQQYLFIFNLQGQLPSTQQMWIESETKGWSGGGNLYGAADFLTMSTLTYHDDYHALPAITYNVTIGGTVPVAEYTDIYGVFPQNTDGKVFLGWDTDPTAQIVVYNPFMRNNPSYIYSPSNSFVMPNTSVDLYAVWEEVGNTVTYMLNGGTYNSNPAAVILHGFSPGPHALNDLTPSGLYHAPSGSYPVILVGWTATPQTAILDKNSTLPALISSVNLPPNARVYAVWGVDTNGNGIPDVLDTKYQVTYKMNGGLYSGSSADRIVGNQLEGTFTLSSGITATNLTHATSGGTAVVFAGWTTSAVTNILTKDDTAPSYITTVPLPPDAVVYAAWGLDTNANGTADVNEPKYTLTYNMNNGLYNGLSNDVVLNNLVAMTYTLSSYITQANLTHAPNGSTPVLFAGWSATPITAIQTKDDTPSYITTKALPPSTTVYAVWGLDTNNNGTPDVNETKYTITYNMNTGTYSGSTAAVVISKLLFGTYTLNDYITTSNLAHATSSGSPVLFIGWTSTALAVLTKDSAVPTFLTNVTLPPNASVYAAWGVDTNNNGIADVLETKYTVTYKMNGGTYSGSGNDQVITNQIAGTYQLALTTANLAHANSGTTKVVFAGWTTSVVTNILTSNDTAPTYVTSMLLPPDAVVYAAWGLDTNNNGTADVNETKYTLTYNMNGGLYSGSGSDRVINNLVAMTYTLADSTLITQANLTHSASSGTPVLFAGWSATAITAIQTKDDTPTYITTKTLGPSTTVYAVWGLDTNNNGQPDVNETKYSVTYKMNTGTYNGSSNDYVVGTQIAGVYTLNLTGTLAHAASSGTPVVFIGWASTAYATLTQNDTAPTILTNVTLGPNAIVYATWGLDTNGNGIADVLETKYTVTYNMNTGTYNNSANDVVINNQVSSTHALNDVVQANLKHANSGTYPVLFIGWTNTALAVLTKDDTAPTTLTSVILPPSTTVYAAWGVDTNNNGTADVLETKYTVTYKMNGGTYNSSLNDVVITNQIAGTYQLNLATANLAHVASSGTPVLFVGWTSSLVSSILTKDDTAPTLLTSVTLGPNATVYAAWGLDTNGNGIPDVLDSRYTVTYKMNGGLYSGSGNDQVMNNVVMGVHNLNDLTQTNLTHANSGSTPVLFVGWTSSAVTNNLTKDDALPTLLTSVTLGPSATVYAAWGVDTNNNGQADILETKYTVTYRMNTGTYNGSTTDQVISNLIAGPHALTDLVTANLAHANSNSISVVFVGWSTTAITSIFTKDDTAPTTLTSVTLGPSAVVYALWGLDTNGNGTADVLETKYTVTYKMNTGAYNGLTTDQVINNQVSGPHALTDLTQTNLTHTPSSGTPVLFVGWTSVAEANILTRDDALPTLLTSVTLPPSATVYAAWGLDTNNNGTPDILESKYTLIYKMNGGLYSGATTDQVISNLVASTHALTDLTQANLTHTASSGTPVLFVGWTTAAVTNILTRQDTAPATVTSQTLPPNATVYAAWGLDENGNGTPDVLETKYTVTYKMNTGTYYGSANDVVINNLVSGSHALTDVTQANLAHTASSGTPVLFVGWTTSVVSNILTKSDVAPTMVTSQTLPPSATVYAAWGLDENGNGTPDVLENKYTVTYKMNGGLYSGSGNDQVISNQVASTHALTDLTQANLTHAASSGTPVLFVGWVSATSNILTRQDTAPTLLTSVTLPPNATVYAAWGLDENGNGTPDVLENKYTVTYKMNTGTYSGSANDQVISNLVSGIHALTDLTQANLAHANSSGTPVLFVGWTNAAVANILTRQDTAPTLLTNVTLGPSATVYAAWGLDENGNGTPDVLETKYTVTYKMNSGLYSGSASDQVISNLVSSTHALTDLTQANLTHTASSGTPVLFVGWTTSAVSNILTRQDTAPAMVTSQILPPSATVYAAWGLDENGNGTPDVLETKYTVTYKMNGGMYSGAITDQVISNLVSSTHALTDLTQANLTHATSSGIPVLFVGWTTTASNILTKSDTLPTLLNNVTLPPSATVYAAWGLDENGNGTPDILETKYTVTYNMNAGTYNGSTTAQVFNNLVFGTHALTDLTQANLAHANSSGTPVLFVGWTATASSVLSKDDILPTLLTSVNLPPSTTVYAAWGLDTNNNGIPDILETKYTVTYKMNGGMYSGATTDQVISNQITSVHALTDLVQANLTHANSGSTPILFVGWTATALGVLTKDDVAPTLLTSQTLPPSAVVYAAWGLDTNNNGTPDVLEPKYTVTYKMNGGTYSGASTDQVFINQVASTHALTDLTQTNLAHVPSGSIPVLFVGWTTAASNILTRQDTAPILLTSVPLPPSAVVYAAWGLDENSNGTPDVLEGKYTLTYNMNTGTYNSSSNDVVINNLVASTHALTDLVQANLTHTNSGGTPVLFVGWTTNVSGILTKDNTLPTLLTMVTLPPNATVYAAWGVDTNNNGTPDILEPKYTVTYKMNTGVYGNSANDQVISNQIAGPHALTDLIQSNLTHADSSGTPVLFVGWTANAANVLTKYDALPTLLTYVTLPPSATVYAAWGLDTNNNGTPDVLETKYTLTYDMNGGTYNYTSTSVVISNIISGVRSLTDLATANISHAKNGSIPVLFVGWASSPITTTLTREDDVPALITSKALPPSSTVYAVWGLDMNGNGTPDVLETKYTVTYKMNGGMYNNGTADQIISKLISGIHTLTDLTIASLTHDNSGSTPVLFVGWTTSATNILTKDDALPTLLTSQALPPSATVYAAWGLDTNNNGIPDILETKYTVTYKMNGGSYNLSNIDRVISNQIASVHALNDLVTPNLTHANSGSTPVLFVGWTATASAILTKDDALPTLFTSVTLPPSATVYAAWGLDTNNNGIPDILEPKYSVTYDMNGGAYYYTSQLVTIDNIIEGPHALADLNSTGITHEPDGSTPVLFVGWSTTPITDILTREDSKPELVTSMDMPPSTTVYAVWGVNTNYIKVPDVLQQKYTLTYNMRGGTYYGSPDDVTIVNLVANTHDLTDIAEIEMQHESVGVVPAPVVFAGWTTDANATKILTKTDTVPNLITSVDLPPNATVYAVWKYDTRKVTIKIDDKNVKVGDDIGYTVTINDPDGVLSEQEKVELIEYINNNITYFVDGKDGVKKAIKPGESEIFAKLDGLDGYDFEIAPAKLSVEAPEIPAPKTGDDITNVFIGSFLALLTAGGALAIRKSKKEEKEVK